MVSVLRDPNGDVIPLIASARVVQHFSGYIWTGERETMTNTILSNVN